MPKLKAEVFTFKPKLPPDASEEVHRVSLWVGEAPCLDLVDIYLAENHILITSGTDHRVNVNLDRVEGCGWTRRKGTET